MPDIEETMRFFSNARFLRMLDSDGRRRLLDAAKPLRFSDGDTVIQEGQPGDALYIIISGIASVLAQDVGDNAKPVAELTDGSLFGEMAVITNQLRSATILAKGDLSVLRIPKQALLEILKDYPKVKEVMAKVGLARTEDTMEKLRQD